MDIQIKGKNALVLGSSKGIGKAAAMELAQLGANIVLAARSGEALKETIKALDRSQGQEHDYLILDLNDLELVSQTISTLVEKKTIHILINNSGGPQGGPIVKADTTAFQQAFQQHVLSAQVITQLVYPGMKEANYGRIINVISTSVKEPISNLGVSNTIRGAMGNWAKTMAGELGAYGITVNNVLPGFTNTDRLKDIIENKAKKQDKSTDQVIIEMKRNVPLRRFADPKEIANAIAFLAGPAAAYISGINLPVDGGRTKSL